MHGITLNFVSLAALAAALPYLSNTPGLVAGEYPAQSGNVNAGTGTSSPATTAHTAPTAAVAPAVAPETKVVDFAPPPQSQPSYTFDQVKVALMAYHAKDANAFGAAMQKFGFTGMDAIAAAPGSWTQLMQYIGADTPATEQPTFEKVASVLQMWAKVNGAAFQQAMMASGLTSLDAVKATPAKWAELLAAAKANGVS
jgi:hypothetical protein